ncbi:MAG: KEOPS complex subunit Cgi121 [Candidatus Thorarchaeota archaeon]
MMRIEQLVREEEDLFVGFVEVLLNPGISKDDVVQMAQKASDGVEAVQILDSRLIADENHVLSAVQNAVNASRGGYMESRSLEVEIAMYASGQRQISRAFEIVGVSSKTEKAVIVVVGDDTSTVEARVNSLVTALGDTASPQFQPDTNRLVEIMDTFGIDDAEVKTITTSTDPAERQDAIAKCVIGRVSLVAFDT